MKEYMGKCHCGKNSFKVSGESGFQFICYCTDCRVLHGGGHLCGMMFDATELTEATETQTYSYKGGSGKDINMHFCPVCSVGLYAYPTEYPGKVVIKVNTLLNADFKPQQSIFSESAFSWDKPLSN